MTTERFLYWAPRVLGIAFALFISMFALDSFSTDDTTGRQILGFMIHLLPTYIVIGGLLVAWKWEGVGGAFFLVLGLAYIFLAWQRFPLIAYVMISGPLFLVGALFLLHRNRHRASLPE